MTRATVVVPVRNDEDGIARCVRALQAQTRELDVVVVDDGSTDRTATIARELGATVLPGGGRGAAHARNVGVAGTGGEFVLFTDGDCVPAPDWAERLLAGFADDVVATKGIYTSEQAEPTARFVQLEYEERYHRMQRYRSLDFLDTYNLAVRRSALLAIGGFDEGFAGASVEDQEMSFRLRVEGEFRFCPTAVVGHRHAASVREYARKKFRIGRGKATILRRHRNRARSDSHTPEGLILQVLSVFCVAPAIAFGFLDPIAAVFALVLVLAFPWLASARLIAANTRRHGLRAGLHALVLVPVRAWSLALGLAFGVVAPLAALGGQVQSELANETPRLQPDESASRVREREHVDA